MRSGNASAGELSNLSGDWKRQTKETDVYKFGLMVVRVLDYGRYRSQNRNPDKARRVLLAMLGGTAAARAADPEIDRLLQSPVGKDWVTNGGNLTNQRYSTLKQIDTTNVKQLKGAWMTRLKGSGFGGK